MRPNALRDGKPAAFTALTCSVTPTVAVPREGFNPPRGSVLVPTAVRLTSQECNSKDTTLGRYATASACAAACADVPDCEYFSWAKPGSTEKETDGVCKWELTSGLKRDNSGQCVDGMTTTSDFDFYEVEQKATVVSDAVFDARSISNYPRLDLGLSDTEYFTSGVTVSMWFRSQEDGTETDRTLLSWSDGKGNPESDSLVLSTDLDGAITPLVGGKSTFAMGGGSSLRSATVNDGRWHHVCFAHRHEANAGGEGGSQESLIYVDGNLEVSFKSELKFRKRGVITVGQRQLNGGEEADTARVKDQAWTGRISQVTVYQSVLDKHGCADAARTGAIADPGASDATAPYTWDDFLGGKRGELVVESPTTAPGALVDAENRARFSSTGLQRQLFTKGSAVFGAGSSGNKGGNAGFSRFRNSWQITDWLVHGAVDNRKSSNVGPIGQSSVGCRWNCGCRQPRQQHVLGRRLLPDGHAEKVLARGAT